MYYVLVIPDSILHYRIEKKLGEGGMGAVFLATDTKLDRKVAIKFLSSDKAKDPESRQRFIHEAKAEAMLSHPNIVTFYEVREAEDHAFIVMEYVEGRSLSEYVQSQKLSVSQILDLVIQAGEGLQVAHEKGVIHRDIKPENIMVTQTGHVKITDFGLARWKGATTITKTGTLMGTVSYMSPEQAEGKKLDHRSDIFSLGVVLYELLGGRRPFEGDSEAVVLYELMNTDPQPLARYARGLPEDLQRIVDKSLRKDSSTRYQSVADLLADLKGLTSARRARRPRNRLALIATAAIVVAAGGYTAYTKLSADNDGATSGLERVAVLPFVNMSDDGANEYFSDGLTEELINALGRMPNLHVAARTSSFHFKDKTGDIGSIGRQLNVTRVLEGSVRKTGSRVRVTAQLINVNDGFHLWSETYDRDLEDVFAVQADIAASVASALRVKLISLQGSAPGSTAHNVDAYDLVLQARYYARQWTIQDIETAIRCYKLAIAIQPDLVTAWAGLSRAYSFQAASLGGLTQKEGMALAREAADRALELDTASAAAHLAVATLKYKWDWDWQGAEASITRALKLEPNNSDAVTMLADLNGTKGRLDRAITLLSKHLERDPLNANVHAFIANWLCRAGRLDEATEAFNTSLALQPNLSSLHVSLGTIHLLKGEYDSALQQMKAESHPVWREIGLALAYHAVGDTVKAQELFRGLTADPEGMQYNIASICAYWGDTKSAFQWLDEAWLNREPGLGYAKTDPLMRPLHADPRWVAFLAKLNLAD